MQINFINAKEDLLSVNNKYEEVLEYAEKLKSEMEEMEECQIALKQL